VSPRRHAAAPPASATGSPTADPPAEPFDRNRDGAGKREFDDELDHVGHRSLL